jgi:hypothetical protein
MREIRALALAALALLLVGGCGSEAKLRKAEFAQLVQILPGRYTSAPVTGVAPAGTLATELDVLPIYAPFLSDYVFYAHEETADDAHRLLSQRLFVLKLGADDKSIVQNTLLFADPGRWREGNVDPDLFKGLMTQDVRGGGGEPLVWKLEGMRYSARTAGPLASLRIELGPDELVLHGGADGSAKVFRRLAR